MDKVKAYRELSTGELVGFDDAQDYAMDHLGITIKEMGEHGTYTQEQVDFMGEFTDWFFSGNWIEVYVDERDVY